MPEPHQARERAAFDRLHARPVRAPAASLRARGTLLSAAECERLMAASESVGYGVTNYNQEYRGNLRMISTDDGMAAAVFERIKPFVPERVDGVDMAGEHLAALDAGHELRRLRKLEVFAEPEAVVAMPPACSTRKAIGAASYSSRSLPSGFFASAG